MSTVFKHQYDTSHLQGANATYVEWLYEQYLAEPGSVLGTPEFGFITNTLNDGRTFRFGTTFAW